MMTSIRFWLHCLLWVVFGLAMLSAIIIVVREELIHRIAQLATTRSLLLGKLRRLALFVIGSIVGERGANIRGRVSAFVVGAVVGCLSLAAWQSVNTHPLVDVLVIKRFDDFHYRMQTDSGQAFNATFCPGTPPDFMPGEKLKYLSYQQEPNCKNLNGHNLGYLAYTDKHGKRIKFEIPVEGGD